MAVNEFLEKRSFAGQVARAGESGIVTVSYINQDTTPIDGGLFVARADDGCKKITAASDMILGVTVVMGIHHEFEPKKNLSVFKIPHGSEIWVQMTDDSTLAEGDAVKIVATGDDAGKISHSGTIDTPFYVTGLNGTLAKIMRDEVVAMTAASDESGS
jgi:hypothetical protein